MEKDSKIVNLSLAVENGVLRHHSRLANAAELPTGVKQPVILNTKHPYTGLLIMDFHVRSRQHGQERVCNELHQRFWIPGLRHAVRSSWSSCQKCKNDRAQPAVPEMAFLPSVRLTPFTIASMGNFGPMTNFVGCR